MTRTLILFVIFSVVLTACATESDEPIITQAPTATLQPIVSNTPRSTSTPVPTRTPFPTFTPTPTLTTIPPTATNTLTPTLTPTISGIIQSSAARVNVREAPDRTGELITSLVPGTGVQVIGQSSNGDWINIRLEDGREGWIFNTLIFIQPSPTPIPSATPSPDLTALFLGTPLPTAIIGGGTVTPTPPDQVRTGTPEATSDATAISDAEDEGEGIIGGVPVIDNDSIYQTATALAGGFTTPEPDDDERVVTLAPEATANGDAPPTAIPPTLTPTRDPETIDKRDVFAFCDRPRYNIPAPGNLREGDYINIWWGWIASTEEQIQDHIDAASFDLQINGEAVEVRDEYIRPIEPLGGQFIAYWYVPYRQPLEAGTYEITYVVTWDRAIFDGSENFGPGTENPFEQEACTITVR